jgi:hypothetical protein
MYCRGAAVSFAVLFALCGLTGCGGSAGNTQTIVAPGKYAPPAQLTPRLRVALPDIAVGNAVGTAADVDLMAAASDELLALLQSSDRFDLIERQRLRQILAEQNQPDLVQPGRLTRPGAIRGTDLLFLGQINDLSIKKQRGPDSISVNGLMQATRIEKVIPRLVIDANVSLALVDVKTGTVDVGRNEKFHLVATPQELGLKLNPDELKDAAEVHLGPEDTRTVLRYLLDKPLRPMLPSIDRWALSTNPQSPNDSQASQSQSPSEAHSVSTTNPTTRAVDRKKQLLLICPDCGYKLTGDEEFCPNCHRKLK